MQLWPGGHQPNDPHQHHQPPQPRLNQLKVDRPPRLQIIRERKDGLNKQDREDSQRQNLSEDPADEERAVELYLGRDDRRHEGRSEHQEDDGEGLEEAEGDG